MNFKNYCHHSFLHGGVYKVTHYYFYMEKKYVLILDYCIGALSIIELTDEEINESYNYEDFESFLMTIEEKYGFRLSDCNWMVSENLNIYRYKNGKEINHA